MEFCAWAVHDSLGHGNADVPTVDRKPVSRQELSSGQRGLQVRTMLFVLRITTVSIHLLGSQFFRALTAGYPAWSA